MHDHGLHLEAADVAVVNHDCKRLSEQLREHVLVEARCQLGLVLDYNRHAMHGLEAEIHQLRLLVLHCEDDYEHDVLKDLLIEAEQALRAVLNYVHDQREEALTEVWVELKVVFDDGKGAITEALVDDGKLTVKLVTHMLHHDREKIEDFWVARILRIRLIIVYQKFKLW